MPAAPRTIDIDALQEQASRAAALLSAMCNEKRLLLLCGLSDGERSVKQLAALLGAPQPTVSQHLSRLRGQGLVRERRDGRTHYYSLTGDEAREILRTLQALYCPPPVEDT